MFRRNDEPTNEVYLDLSGFNLTSEQISLLEQNKLKDIIDLSKQVKKDAESSDISIGDIYKLYKDITNIAIGGAKIKIGVGSDPLLKVVGNIGIKTITFEIPI